MWKVAALVWVVLGTTLAGALVVVIVSVPSLFGQGMRLIPAAAAVGFTIAVPAAVLIAKKIVAATAPRA